MGFLSESLNPESSQTIGSKLGGLNPKIVMDGVKGIFAKSGEAVEKCAEFCGIFPEEEKSLPFVREQMQQAGLGDLGEILINDPISLAPVWKTINRSDWEEFIVPDESVDIDRYQPIVDAAAGNADFERAIQVLAEYRFHRLYLFRCLALGLTATEENWAMRAKINAFRNFFLRLALPGGKYDKFISYYIILTSEKDAWDEMRHGQNGKLGFVIDSIANIGSVKLSSMFEAKIEKLISDKFNELTGETQRAAEEASGVGVIPGRGKDLRGKVLNSGGLALSCPQCGRRIPPVNRGMCMYCGYRL